MSDSSCIKRHKDPRENAREILDYLDGIFSEDRLGDDRLLHALYSDVSGLLAGISQGTIRTGQPRIVEQLIRIVQNYPNEKDPSPIAEAIGACSERGLAVAGHVFPGILRTAEEHER